MKLARCLLMLVWLATPLSAQELDWEVEEKPAGPALSWVRGVRDGLIGLVDNLSDLQTGAFAELALVGGQIVMGGSDLIGLVDDNPLTQHVFKGVASKSLARTAYLMHIAGAEAILGSHGLESEWYLEAELVELNPLLQGEDAGPRLPADPLAFVGEGMFHGDAYRVHLPGSVALAAIASDLALRPLGNLMRIVGWRAGADRLEQSGRGLIRRAID
jgi:hypothetical protein